MITVNDLRRSFIKFFEDEKHKIIQSSSLIPKDDPTLLFTTAGMVQFKPMFAGIVKLDYTRAASIQKCIRTSDLENVGKTKRHLTFFEMLGNFSFGDYFKKEAIRFAWDYSTKIIKFPEEKIWISIYEDDDEAYDLWVNYIGLSKDKIVRLGKKDNFWGPAGDAGACGPCSELHLDRGAAYGCGSDDCKPGCDCERYMEYWNLVFNQFYQNADGVQNPLPSTGIDTGMGLERLATLVQNVDSIYETDEFIKIINFISKISGAKYEGENIVPIRIIAEHARTLTFAISDGVYPSNDGRGYVLRRILRRGLRYTRKLKITEPMIYKIVDPIIEIMGEFYPDIIDSKENIKNVLKNEEQRFLETIENGMDRIDQIISELTEKKKDTVSGKDAFMLYDTFGFPLEMTTEIAEENNYKVDIDSFNEEMEKQRNRGKNSWKGADGELSDLSDIISSDNDETVFLGYENDKSESSVVSIYKNGEKTDKISSGDEAVIVLNQTPLYAESGGQAGDSGIIESNSSNKFIVSDTKKYNNIIVHIGRMEKGEIKAGDKVSAEIDSSRKNLIKANHTATHLLQAALRQVLGKHIKQAGSQVDNEKFRFDFTHFNAMTTEELEEVENIVNQKIWENIELETKIMNIDDAIKSGAMAEFGEKYDDNVRVVSVDNFSKELCGGTHVSFTSSIGVFKILKESSPGAGIRRIEGVTLEGLFNKFKSDNTLVNSLAQLLTVPDHEIIKKITTMTADIKILEKEIKKLSQSNLSEVIDEIISKAIIVDDIKIMSHIFDDIDNGQLKELSDSIREKEEKSVIFFASKSKKKVSLIFAGTKKTTEKGIDCGTVMKQVSPIIDGKGGGRKDMAQGGGILPEKTEECLKKSIDIARQQITGV